jgi:hypothetical protein
MHCSLDHQCGLLDSTAPTCLHEGLIGSALVAIPQGLELAGTLLCSASAAA